MKKYFIIPLIGLSLASCSLDDNINPNHPLEQQVGARQRLAAAQTGSFSTFASSMNQLGNIWMNSWSGNIYYFGNPLTKETNLNIDTNFYQSIWNNTYVNVSNLQTIIDSDSSKNLPYHRAIAKILKAHYMQYIVDLYNDVPYSEAFKGQNNIAPKYDKAEDVYKALVLEINDAIKLINESTPSDAINVNSNEDVMMGGDMDKWLAFANTVKLRYLVRQSRTTNAAAKAFVQSQLPTLQNATFITEDVKINPGYSASTPANQNPRYAAFGLRLTNGSINTYGYRLFKASDHIAKALNGDAGAVTTGVSDPRASKLFRPVGGKISGIVQGALKDESKEEKNFSFFGGDLALGADEGSSKDGYVMLKAEAEFLLADAAIEFPQYFSNAKSHFEQGIRDSFAMLGAGDATNYINSVDSKAGAGWTATASKTEAIQYQRWIALTSYNGMETYLNYLKTGYPVTPLAVNAQKPRKPYRLLYPATEYSTNASNVPAMNQDDPFTLNQFTPFWLK